MSVTTVFDDADADVLPRLRTEDSDALREKDDFRSLLRKLGTEDPRWEPLNGGGAEEPSRVVGREADVEEAKVLRDDCPKPGMLIGPCIVGTVGYEPGCVNWSIRKLAAT